MAERQVTVDAERYPLSHEFFVIATQNPIDQHGTYPLPEAQLDRFAMKLTVGYPDSQDEVQMLSDAVQGGDEPVAVPQLLQSGQLRALQQHVARLRVDPSLQQDLVQLGSATRNHPQITLGTSPRGLLQWQRAAQAKAMLSGRDFVTPDDIQQIAIPVLSVRLGVDQDNPIPVIEQILSSVAIPEYRL
jgi:MoxR-like ATPase